MKSVITERKMLSHSCLVSACLWLGLIGLSLVGALEDDDRQLDTKNLVAGGYLFAENSSSRLDLNNPLDKNVMHILKRDGIDIRASRDCHEWTDISVDMSKRAWNLTYEHAKKAINDRIDLARPTIENLLIKAKVSDGCLKASQQVLEAAKRMESWAVKLINSWGGFPPAGVFEGTYSEAGSYHVCVNIEDKDMLGGHAHHCALYLRPLMPSRKPYELVVNQEPPELVYQFENNEFSGDRKRNAFTDYLEHAQYHHFLYFKLNTCWPIKCTPFDVRRVSKQLGLMNALVTGPIKCFSRFKDDYEEPSSVDSDVPADGQVAPVNETATSKGLKKLVVSVWDLNDGIFIAKPFFETPQKVALSILLTLTCFILIMTFIDLFYIRLPKLIDTLVNYQKIATNSNGLAPSAVPMGDLQLNIATEADTTDPCKQIDRLLEQPKRESLRKEATKQDRQSYVKTEVLLIELCQDCSIITSIGSFFRISKGQLKNDILCLNGIRCILMAWIVMTHTMMYNDWSEFARSIEIEKSVKSLVAQPLFNASYLVDTFFLISGLLSAYTTFRYCKGKLENLQILSYLVARWLRLTPQVMLLSIIYILIPHLSHGPHYHSYVGEYAENCVNNWWINLFHMQAFVEKEKMCNYVTWWVSIDFFYHIVALAFVWIILANGHRMGTWSMVTLCSSFVAYMSWRHQHLGLPPNVFSTMPQIGKMWSDMTLDFAWTPYAHAVPFFGGFYVGYLMVMKRDAIERTLNYRSASLLWSITIVFLMGQGYSTYWWVIGKSTYTQFQATLFNVSLPIFWTACICWIIVACHFGYGGALNTILSGRVFLVLGKASYMVYLSHFQVMFFFFGNQTVLLEPTGIVMFYIIIGNITVATIYGSLLNIIYESPWLKLSRRLLK